MNKDRFIFGANITFALIMNYMIWMIFNDIGLFKLDNLTIQIARYLGIITVVLMFTGAIYLTFNLSLFKEINNRLIINERAFVYAGILFIGLLSFNFVAKIIT